MTNLTPLLENAIKARVNQHIALIRTAHIEDTYKTASIKSINRYLIALR